MAGQYFLRKNPTWLYEDSICGPQKIIPDMFPRPEYRFYKDDNFTRYTDAKYAVPPKCPEAVIHEIVKANISDRRAVKVTEDLSECRYIGSTVSGQYVMFRFYNDEYTSDYYFIKTTVDHKLFWLEIESGLSFLAMKVSDMLSYGGDIPNSPDWLQYVAVAANFITGAITDWHYSVQDELDYYKSLEGDAYVFQFVKTYRTRNTLYGDYSAPIVYP